MEKCNKEKIIIMGDIIAHHTSWNCEWSDKKGKVLWEVLNEEEMRVINKKTQSHIGNNNQRFEYRFSYRE